MLPFHLRVGHGADGLVGRLEFVVHLAHANHEDRIAERAGAEHRPRGPLEDRIEQRSLEKHRLLRRLPLVDRDGLEHGAESPRHLLGTVPSLEPIGRLTHRPERLVDLALLADQIG